MMDGSGKVVAAASGEWCSEIRWDLKGDPKRSSNGELVPGAEWVIELSVEGVDAPDNCLVEAGVTVAVFSRLRVQMRKDLKIGQRPWNWQQYVL